MARVVLIISLLLFTSAAPTQLDEAWLDRGAAVLSPFKKQLKAELMQGMKKGTANAIDVCRVQAPAIARAAGSESVLMGRTSHRLRNPTNTPRPWMKPLLEAYLENPADRSPRVVKLEGGGVGYVEPILTMPLCLTCHGNSISEATRTALDKSYPDDEAIGFENGDLRGLFWVEFKE